jgi:hypothetical protein
MLLDRGWSVRLLVAVAFSLATLSSAATLDLTGSIGSSIASGNHEVSSYSGNDAFGTVRFDANPRGSDITWSSGNGLGVDCSNWNLSCIVDTENQIDWPEVLEVSFEQPLFITSIDVSQLAQRTAWLGPLRLRVVDAGAIEGSGFDILFNAGDANDDGNLNIAVNQFASSISFVPTAGILSDFSLARITIDETLSSLRTSSPIPEPSSVVMLLIGGALVASQLRRFV